jgi:hypothetical protein
MKTKDKVKYWLKMYPKLRDDDNRLCANIWAEELTHIEGITQQTPIVEFLKLYASNKFTSAPSIKRARAKLQEEEPKYRGQKYNLRKGILQDKWRKDLGYENNK